MVEERTIKIILDKDGEKVCETLKGALYTWSPKNLVLEDLLLEIRTGRKTMTWIKLSQNRFQLVRRI